MFKVFHENIIYVYSIWLDSTQSSYDDKYCSERGYVCMVCYCFAFSETVRIKTGVTVATFKVHLSYPGTRQLFLSDWLETACLFCNGNCTS